VTGHPQVPDQAPGLVIGTVPGQPADPAATGGGDALTEGERALLARLPGDRATEATRLAAAKDAAAGAAAAFCGPDGFVVTAVDADRLLVAAPDSITAVESCVLEEHVVAWAVTTQHRDNDGVEGDRS
jgi:hypothetical protein